MLSIQKGALLLMAAVLMVSTLMAQVPARNTDSAVRNGINVFQGRGNAGIKPYNEVITAKAKTDDGLFKVHKVDDKFYFEMADSVMDRDILVVARISKAAIGAKNSFLGYAGDQIGENVIQFSKGPNNKVFIKSISYSERSADSSKDGMYRSVLNSNVQPLVASFDIRAFSKDSAGVVIDVTDYINGDNDVFFFESQYKRGLGVSNYLPDRSYIQTVKSFPLNVEIKTVKTYTKLTSSTVGQPVFGAMPGGAPATYELNTSIVMLPKAAMRPRYFDERVGFFASTYVDFDANPQAVETKSIVRRWRLELTPGDVEKYKKGELAEPVKPIVIYIDPTTPKKWVPYLIMGVNDWQKAFEKAGFKNAIMAKEAPANDPEWSLEDARHSAIVYKPSNVENASGPSVVDPRSGEIIETHINWYHNVMSLLYKWYFVQCAPNDARARKPKFDDELMGQLVRFVSSHEVGHTLGLRHNFGSSSTVPVEKLRDKKWVEAHGHTPSIMDYARFNYVAQPEDNISETGLFPRIGDYDNWAIQWGYSYIDEAKNADEEKAILNKLIIEKLKDKRLWFGTESDPADPRNQSEDLGDNAMKAGAYGIKNLQRILPNLIEWTKAPNDGYDKVADMYSNVLGQFNRYIGHVTKNIGGMLNTPKTIEQTGAVYEYASKATQKEAMAFLQKQLFKTPVWLIDKKLYSLTASATAANVASIQDAALARLISANTINKLLQSETFDAGAAYTASEMLNDLKKGIWSELPAHNAIDIHRRNLQKMYVEKLIALLTPLPAPSPINVGSNTFFITPAGISKTTDGLSIIKGHTKRLMTEIKLAAAMVNDSATKLHLQDVWERLDTALDTKK
jgi:Met-zincin/Domain of unknown function (DUF5117)/Domain of unknown function (DUF5118)